MAHLTRCKECSRVFRCDTDHKILRFTALVRTQKCHCPDELFHGIEVFVPFARYRTMIYAEQNIDVDAPLHINPSAWPWKPGKPSLELT